VGVSPGDDIPGASDITFTTQPLVHGIADTSTAADAKLAVTAAYLEASLRVAGVQAIGFVEIGGHTFSPGLYKTTAALEVSGVVTLSGRGVYIFQIEETLKVGEF
jgi:hypothetical protein